MATHAVALEGFPFRNLRHTGATLALQEGTNPVLVAFRLGHTSTAMIERHYGELVDGFDREIADRLSAARNKSRRTPDLAPVSSLAAAWRFRRTLQREALTERHKAPDVLIPSRLRVSPARTQYLTDLAMHA
jgi:hypothetical protein